MDEERWRKFRADFGATGDREALVKEYGKRPTNPIWLTA
jgi:hypothetical protein